MPILTLGISFRRAPIELLERLSFADGDLVKGYRHALEMEAVDEAVILSTCNRVEIYANVPTYHAGFLALKRLLTETRGVAPEELAEPLYSHWEQDAADHLFAVASGLDSMVLGETQIHAQVREALRTAEAEGASGPATRSLFHAASRAGRRARAETSLGAAPDAFVALGADLATDALGDLRGRDVVVVGAGQMAGLAVKHLRERGVGTIRVVNRSLERARALAERSGDGFAGLDQLSPAIARRRPGGVRHRRHRGGDRCARRRGARSTVAGARRSCCWTSPSRATSTADVEALDGVRVIDIRAIRERSMARGDTATDDIARAHEIVAEEVRRWVVRRRSDALAPLIRAVRARGDEVVRVGARPLREPVERADARSSAKPSRRSHAASRRSSCTIRSSS